VPSAVLYTLAMNPDWGFEDRDAVAVLGNLAAFTPNAGNYRTISLYIFLFLLSRAKQQSFEQIALPAWTICKCFAQAEGREVRCTLCWESLNDGIGSSRGDNPA